MSTSKRWIQCLIPAIAVATWGCSSSATSVQNAVGAQSNNQALPMTPEQRAGSVSYQMNTAVDALSKASNKVSELKKETADTYLDKIDALLYAAGESIGDYPNNPPANKKGEDLKSWTAKATAAANSALTQIEQAEQLVKNSELAADLRAADDSLKGAIQTAKAE